MLSHHFPAAPSLALARFFHFVGAVSVNFGLTTQVVFCVRSPPWFLFLPVSAARGYRASVGKHGG